jgi:nuclear pore complex protein Nup133
MTRQTSNDNYAVIQLHALPDRMRSRPDGEKASLGSSHSTHVSPEMYHGSIYSDAGTGHGLALSSTTATIWSYNSSSTSPETFTFRLADPSRTSLDQPPLGSLVYSSTSATDLGLIVITPRNGKIVYWESVTGAAALDHNGRQRNGVEGSVGGLFSGDTVIELLSAEPAGFILRFASGRLAHLSIRDGQGRPSVLVHYMKGHVQTQNSGLFGGIISAFGNHGWRKDVVSIKAGRTSKQLDREIIVATDQGHFQVWEVHRNGQHMLRNEVDAKDAMLHITASADFASEGQRASNFQLLDFVLIPDSYDPDSDQQIAKDTGINILALVAFVDNDHASYRLVDMSINNGAIATHASTSIRCYTEAPESSSDHTANRPVTLLLPKPGNLAFVIFCRAIVLVSVIRPVETPEQQLFRESRAPSPLFQDVVDFRAGSTAMIVGCGSEDASDSQHISLDDSRHSRRKSRYPGCIALVKGFGVVRLSSFTATSASAIIDSPSITVKSKIEQAIFYGTSPQNILNFIGRPEVQFPIVEVEQAALEVSQEILNSTSAAIPAITPSMNAHLTNRARALRHLAIYLKNAHPTLSLNVRWKLLADAEKLCGARAVWKLYNASLKGQRLEEYDEAQDDIPYGERASALAAIIDCLPPDAYTPLRPENGEVDPVRNWFSKDVDRIEVVVSMTYRTLAELTKEGLKDDFTLMRAIGEANDVCLGAIGTALRFRQDNLPLYSLGDQNLQDGVLVELASYRDLAPFWTSALSGPGLSVTIPQALKQMIDIVKEISLQFLGKTKHPFPGRRPDPRTAEKVRLDCVSLLDLYSRVGWEAYAWLESRADRQQREISCLWCPVNAPRREITRGQCCRHIPLRRQGRPS